MKEPGRELDAKIATNVLGWKIFCGCNPKNDNPGHGQWEKPNGEKVGLGFSPSTSIADAWIIVEEMRKRKKYVYVMCFVDDFFRCEIREYRANNGGDTLIADEAGDTAPHAICLAALAVDNS